MDIKKPKNLKGKKSTLHKKRKKASKALKAKAKGYISGENKLVQSNPKRITNDSMTKHRKEVLAGAKKFKYPLQHSKYKIAIISSVLLAVTLLLFGAFSYSLLYKQQNIGDFAYRVSKIVPVPVARVGSSWVSFEKYLFEVRQNAHYLINQENVDFESPEGQNAMRDLKVASLLRVQENEIVRQLAAQNGISVSNEEIDNQISKIRDTSGVGDDSQTLEDTLNDFYGWDINDLRRVIKDQLLKQKIVSVVDTETRSAADIAYAAITDGSKTFKAAALEFSEDELTKDKGGVIGLIKRDNKDLPESLVTAVFELSDGEVSGIVESSFGLHIIKRIDSNGEDEVTIAHVLIKWNDPQVFIDRYKEETEIRSFISF